MADLEERLKTFLQSRSPADGIVTLHPDASTRGYFRIPWNGASAVACVYPNRLDPALGNYVDVTGLFLASGLPVAEIIDLDVELSIVLQEDLGDRIVRDALSIAGPHKAEELMNEAITMIARIQAATPLAYERDSIASRLRFDIEKLTWELNYFKEHYFTTLRHRPLSPSDDEALTREFLGISTELETCAAVLCHRDFHSANLMIDPAGRLRIIDHQDARIGSVAYDLVSLLLDRVNALPDPAWLQEKKAVFLKQRTEYGLAAIDGETFDHEFDLQTIQRCLKAAGTFSYQSAVRGKEHFVPFIDPMFEASLAASERLQRFPVLRDVLERETAF